MLCLKSAVHFVVSIRRCQKLVTRSTGCQAGGATPVEYTVDTAVDVLRRNFKKVRTAIIIIIIVIISS
jgi:hypothetical protein